VKAGFVAWTSSQKSNCVLETAERKAMKKLPFVMLAVGLAGAMTASASLTVVETGVNPDEIVTLNIPNSIYLGSYIGEAKAGIYNITVDGTSFNAFCIDLSRVSGTSSDYSYSALDAAPLSPSGPMGVVIATDIEKLWAAHYTSALSSSLDAAALQVAIWNLVVPSATVSGNNQVTSLATTWINDLPNLTATVNLIAVVSPTHQNYVIVPEPATMITGALLLVPFGFSTLRMMRRRAA
jgi:hypothetical protein